MIRSFFARRRPGQVLLAWCVYWVGLILVKLGPALPILWRMTRPDAHGSANAGVNGGIVSATISDSGNAVWTGSISFLHLTLLLTIPPLVIWLVWLVGSSRTNNADEIGLKNETRQRELHGTEPRIGIVETSSTSPSKLREREES